ncbi:MAG: methyltransferase [Candidatus Micrarchaeota archaeon]|nr:methyltransferase [Candidatus Micrarchaeota archaeon]MDE1824602.1 methyltransferase [Candidatus Micrarchaeota archaeon]
MTCGRLEIRVPEGVYEPREDSLLARAALGEIIEGAGKSGLTVLDVGTGSGILGLSAASYPNVSSVTMSDINEKALSAARENLQKNRAEMHAKCTFIRSDLFSGIRGKFGIIIFNAPYLPHSSIDTGMESRAWDGGEEGTELSIRFLDGALPHLEENGEILLVASSFGNMLQLRKGIERMGLKIEKTFKEHYFFEDIAALVILRR